MGDDNTERFLNAFITIEGYLRKLCRANRYETFYALLLKARDKNPAVKVYADDLRQYADLRNAIVHERRDGKPLAEPYTTTVTDIEAIRDRLLLPPLAISAFNHEVKTCAPEDKVGIAAKLMYDGNFSQLPVYEHKQFVALLTAETIARWLGVMCERCR